MDKIITVTCQIPESKKGLLRAFAKELRTGEFLCIGCGQPFMPIRSDAKYCSASCRNMACRRRKR